MRLAPILALSAFTFAALGASLAAGGAASLVAQEREAPRPAPRTIPELEARIREVLARTHTTGLSLAIVTRDSVRYAGGLGLADVASRRQATGKTLFRIGSTSKAFTALAVLMEQEAGKLWLEDPISKHIPEITFENRWERTNPVRIVNALEHTTGFDDWEIRDYAKIAPDTMTVRQGLDFARGSRVSRWRPGTRVSYCNSGPPLAAYIVEKLEGKPFERVVQERLFDPIGMKTATFLFPDTTVAPLATLYEDDGVTPNPYWHVLMRPAGSINASAEDMAAYVRFLLNRGAVDGRQLLPPSAIDRLERSEASPEARAGLPVGYGLHIARYVVDSGFVWTGHDGGVNGGLTNMAYLPEQGVGYAFMINTGNGEAQRQVSRLVRGFVTEGLPRLAPPPRGAMPAAARATYTGWFRPDNPRAQHLYFAERLMGLARVTADDSGLVIAPLGGTAKRYVPVSGMTFRGEREPVATLALMDDSADGRPVVIERMGYLLPTSLVRVATPVAWLEMALTALCLLALVVAAVAMVVGVVRALVRRRAAPSRARASWRASIAALIALVVGVVLLLRSTSRNGAYAPGRDPINTVGGWLLLLAFAALAIAALVLAFRRAPRGVGGGGASLALARGVAILDVITVAYLTYWGFIGWRLWA
jgi:CubicO group peptidase (beta-lactamase class C family)